MAGVEDDRVVRGIEHPVQAQRELHHTEVRAEVPAGGSNLMDQELADLHREFCQLVLGEVLQIGGAPDLFEHRISLRTLAG